MILDKFRFKNVRYGFVWEAQQYAQLEESKQMSDE